MVEEEASGREKRLVLVGRDDEGLAANLHVAPKPYPGPPTVEAAPNAVCLVIITSAGAVCHQLGFPQIRRWHR